MNKSAYNSKGYFTKERFFRLIDADRILGYATLQHYWEEYVISSMQDLNAFYQSLDPQNPTSEYIQKCVDNHFRGEVKGVAKEDGRIIRK